MDEYAGAFDELYENVFLAFRVWHGNVIFSTPQVYTLRVVVPLMEIDNFLFFSLSHFANFPPIYGFFAKDTQA